MRSCLTLTALSIFLLLSGCANKPSRMISSVDDSNDRDVSVAPGERIFMSKPGWVRGKAKDLQGARTKKPNTCKCRLIYHEASGYSLPVTTQSFPDAVTSKNETPPQSCERVNGAPPSFPERGVHYTWEGYECGPKDAVTAVPARPHSQLTAKWSCQCKLVKHSSDGEEDIQTGDSTVIYDDGSGSCSSVNGGTPESSNRGVYFSWDTFDCKEY
jgi:hypothetical protein